MSMLTWCQITPMCVSTLFGLSIPLCVFGAVKTKPSARNFKTSTEIYLPNMCRLSSLILLTIL